MVTVTNNIIFNSHAILGEVTKVKSFHVNQDFVSMIHPFDHNHKTVGGAVAKWSVRSFLERVVQVRALAEDIVLCSWATLTVPLSTQQ